MFANKIHEEAHEQIKNGNIEEALRLYTLAISENPDDANLVSDRGVAYLHSNDSIKCFEDLNLAIDLQPEYAFRYACRAFAHSHFKNLDAAISDYEKAIELDPEDSIAYNNLGLLLEQKGYKKQADERFDRADKLSKMEDHLLDLMDHIEGAEESPDDPTTKKSEETYKEINPSIQREKNINTFKALKKVFTSKKEFKDFIHFIKNGFKIK